MSKRQSKVRQTLSAILTVFLVAGMLISGGVTTFAAEDNIDVVNLLVDYTETPLGIDVEKPTFSWQMIAPEGERGYSQSAYQLVVKDEKGTVVWDTGKIESDESVGIQYAGEDLEATTRYTWTVTVWDQDGHTASESSWFETGLI